MKENKRSIHCCRINTFGMDVKASVFVEYGSVAELKAILSNKDYLKPSWLHIGGGSNFVVYGRL